MILSYYEIICSANTHSHTHPKGDNDEPLYNTEDFDDVPPLNLTEMKPSD